MSVNNRGVQLLATLWYDNIAIPLRFVSSSSLTVFVLWLSVNFDPGCVRSDGGLWMLNVMVVLWRVFLYTALFCWM